MNKFDYESKTWGGGEVRLSPFCLGASQLKFALEDLKTIKSTDSTGSPRRADSTGSPPRVLEVGCGAGRMVKAVKFYRPELEVLGIDISKKAILQARENSQGVEFLVGDIGRLPFEDKSMDGVLMFDLLEHIKEPLLALDEVNRVLKPRGIFSAFTPIEGSPFSIWWMATKLFGFKGKEKYGGHIQQYTLKDLLKLLRQSHLKLLKKRYFGHFFFQLVDFAYFAFLSFRGKNVSSSVEGYLAQERGFGRNLLAAVKSAIATVSYFESKIFWFLPASGVHLTALRSD
jgi:ubiquinone/menaquinone biosynthesis C-methylase UbiE